jgi:TolA-binding protein
MRKAVMAAMMATGLVVAMPAGAQTTTVDGRLTQLEKRLNTVERVLINKNGGPLVQPEIGPATPVINTDGTPASAPLADLQAKVNAVESELAGLTGRIETAEHRLSQLELDFAAYKKSTDARIRALEERTADAGDVAAPTPKPGTAPPVSATLPPKPAADPTRATRIAAVVKPTGKDAADKGTYAYNYGYRFWQAKLYPEAETQLEKFATRFPGHRLVSRAGNVLGLIYLDDNRPKDAATTFYDNYSKLPDGDRAPDSLLNLTKAMAALKRPSADICEVYKELGDVYGTQLSAAQQAEAAKGRAANKCR